MAGCVVLVWCQLEWGSGRLAMPRSSGSQSVRRHTIRAFGILLALGCVLLGDSRSRAVAQGGTEYVDIADPRVQALLADPTWCWTSDWKGRGIALSGSSVISQISNLPDAIPSQNAKATETAIVRDGHVVEIRWRYPDVVTISE